VFFLQLHWLLPLALAVAASPVAVFGVTRMTLAAPVSMAPDWGFLVGWVVGLLAVAGLAGAIVGLVTSLLKGTAATVVVGLLRLALGVLMWVIALRRWRARPRPGEPARWPSWVQGAAEADPARASGLGFALAALDLKNLVLAGTAGTLVVHSSLSFGGVLGSLLVFALVASSALLFITVGFRTARHKVEAPLGRLASGLELNLGGIESAALLVAGAILVGFGLQIFA